MVLSAIFIKKIIDNTIYMGKIAYGSRRTEKKIETRNETQGEEQLDCPVYEEFMKQLYPRKKGILHRKNVQKIITSVNKFIIRNVHIFCLEY